MRLYIQNFDTIRHLLLLNPSFKGNIVVMHVHK